MKKNFLQWIVMSAALILFGATAVAQEVKEEKANGTISTTSVTDESYGVIVGGSGSVLVPGEIRLFQIRLLEGYINPVLIYENNVDSQMDGPVFSAIIVKLNGNYFVQVTAKTPSKATSDTVYIKAVEAYPEYGTNSTSASPGAPLTITVDPN